MFDDILAALIASLAMMRRIPVRTSRAEHHPNVAPADFERWRAQALRAFNLLASASLLKVVLSQGWRIIALRAGVGAPWFQLGGLVVALAWIVSLVWAWKMATDARVLRVQLGIDLQRELSPAAAQRGGGGSVSERGGR